jgi:hypothetical protein
MNPTDSDLKEIKDTLDNYKETVVDGGELDEINDALELDIDGGRIWLHPRSDGFSVDIHYFNDTGDKDTKFNGTGVVMNYLMRDIGFPSHGEFEPHTPFFSNERRTHRVNFEYFVDR